MIAALAFCVAAALVGFVFCTTDWVRVWTILATRQDPRALAESDQHRWRRVHLDADRRQPFGRSKSS